MRRFFVAAVAAFLLSTAGPASTDLVRTFDRDQLTIDGATPDGVKPDGAKDLRVAPGCVDVAGLG